MAICMKKLIDNPKKITYSIIRNCWISRLCRKRRYV